MSIKPFNITTELAEPLAFSTRVSIAYANKVTAEINSLKNDPLAKDEIQSLREYRTSILFLAGLHNIGWKACDYLINYNLIKEDIISEKRNSYAFHLPQNVYTHEQVMPLQSLSNDDCKVFQKYFIHGLKRSQINIAELYINEDFDQNYKNNLTCITVAQGLAIDLIENAYDKEIINPANEMLIILNSALAINHTIKNVRKKGDNQQLENLYYIKRPIRDYLLENNFTDLEDRLVLPKTSEWKAVRHEAYMMSIAKGHKDAFVPN